jgi:hypothetical protein
VEGKLMARIAATGYVHNMIDKAQTFEQFACSCARAFGPLIEMRDDSMDAPIPERIEPSDYDAKAMEKENAEHARLSAMTTDQQLAFGESLKVAEIDRHVKSRADMQADIDKCRTMLAEVGRWEPPTKDHVGLKKFMREQLEQSIGRDDAILDKWIAESRARPAMEYFEQALQSASRGIEYHTREHEKEVALATSRTDWLVQLRKSLTKSPSR